MSHPLGELIARAVDDDPPPVDGGWHRVPPWRDGVEAVVAMTGHAALAVGDDVTDERVEALGVDGFGGAHHPRVLLDLAGPTGWIDSLDALLAIRSPGGRTTLVERDDLADHPRVRFAQTLRDVVHVLGPTDTRQQALVIVSRGIGGLWELSVEVAPELRGRGLGAELVRGGIACVPRGDVVVAAVAPGNVASERAIRRCGLRVVAACQLFRPMRDQV